MNNPIMNLHTLGILAFVRGKLKTSYRLPSIELWDNEFCNILNTIQFDKNTKFSLSNKLQKIENKEILDMFNSFKYISPVVNIYIYESLPTDFVRFTDTVILKYRTEECVRLCADSIKKGLSLLNKFNDRKNNILENETQSLCEQKREIVEKKCEEIKQICALQAHFTADNKRSVIGSDNDIWNELLQNANDRINDGILNIKITDTELILSYNETGFSAKDFMAIATSGNSGNVDDTANGNDILLATGHKGTGFKSIYNVFDKVIVQSGYVKCVLDDAQKVECTFDKDKIKKVNYSVWNGEKKYFPVPEFYYSDIMYKCTTIKLSFINDTKKNTFIAKNLLSTVEEFSTNKYFYFLENIKQFKINGETFDKLSFISKNFYKYKNEFPVDAELLCNNPRYKNITVDKFIDNAKNKITVLFPKKDMPQNTTLFCNLPIANATLDIPFYINIPALELEDGRNSVSNSSNTIYWNSYIQDIVFNRFSLKQILNIFAKEHPDIAYKYFPYKYLNIWECLKDVLFIKTITNDTNKYVLKSINQW